ncbi:MAG: hypothetical protein CME59_13705 [Halioglobus sp.]|nr:hypothetical protein [Halioglobus sp.]
MTRLAVTLSLALAAQLALAVALYWAGPTETTEREPLVAALASVDRLLISDAQQQTTLVRDGDGWLIEQLDNLPADSRRVSDALDRIGGVALGFPVTTSSSAHERFEVARDNHQRHLQLYAGREPLGAVYLGTSPGFRQLHLRRTGEDEVYTVRMNVFDYPADPQQWLDRQLLAVDSISRVEGEDYILQRDEDRWLLGSGGEADPAGAQALVEAFGSLRITGVGEALAADAVQETSVTVTGADAPLTFSFFSDGEQYRVSRSDLQGLFSLSQYEYERIAGVGHADLLAAHGDDAALDTDTPAADREAAAHEEEDAGQAGDSATAAG